MLPLRPGQKVPQDPVFKGPPLWIHEAVAAAVLSRRESKRRAVLKLLDRIPLWPGTKKVATPLSAPRPPATRRSPS